jgi:hypothetical protein
MIRHCVYRVSMRELMMNISVVRINLGKIWIGSNSIKLIGLVSCFVNWKHRHLSLVRETSAWQVHVISSVNGRLFTGHCHFNTGSVLQTRKTSSVLLMLLVSTYVHLLRSFSQLLHVPWHNHVSCHLIRRLEKTISVKHTVIISLSHHLWMTNWVTWFSDATRMVSGL